MSPVEQFLYNTLIKSPGFNRFVTRVYNKVNGIRVQDIREQYTPSFGDKFNAFRIIWVDEFKNFFR
ncbi:MIOREX complex component 7 [[Candida] jaroonii]|uniref:MIOREX complex component 7 n=1 Tax=[Candida] jaroonii TaxID=467808 RepID=A0ACA9Y9I4_9ASCO|nr:MIOREX complex component 7 [[Candida] jaroonii]